MYLLENPSKEVLEEYYEKYSPVVSSQLGRILHDEEIEVKQDRRAKFRLKVKASPGTALRKFIEKYTKEEHLRRLLIGDFSQLLAIINEAKTIEPKFEVKVSKAKHGKSRSKDAEFIFEDLNGIFSQLFVNEIYENVGVFDKKYVTEKKNISYCPYCGEIDVRIATSREGDSVKSPLDHYLPKSKFPFLALSFYNLFPACTLCNDVHCKGAASPLATDFSKELLMYPHKFNDDAITFAVDYSGEGSFNISNFEINADCHGDRDLENMYENIIKIFPRYRNKKEIVTNLFNRMDSMNKDYLKLNPSVDASVLRDMLKFFNIMGYSESPESARSQSMYKFKRDIFNQLCSLLPVSRLP